MARTRQGQGQTLSGSPSSQFTNFAQKPLQAIRAPTAADTGYEIGQTWVDTSTAIIYGLGSVSAGNATWNIMSPGASDVDTLTGDTGGAVPPTAGNINILGSSGLTVAGAGSTLTIQPSVSGFPITPFVVGISGEAGYQTVQAAISAAVSAGGGTVYVQPGTFTEDLTLSDGVMVVGTIDENTIIVGTHTPPTTGNFAFQNITLQDGTAIFSSASAGSAILTLEQCIINVTNGHTFDIVNWTGELNIFNCGFIGTNDGVINNTGGSPVVSNSSDFGNGLLNAFVISGATNIRDIELRCPGTFQGSGEIDIADCVFLGTITTAGSVSLLMANSVIQTDATPAFVQGSSGIVFLNNVIINTSNNPAIDGAGAGVLNLGSVDFTDNSARAGTLTIGTADVLDSAAFRTSVLATGVTYSANTIIATGSDTDISITFTPKGTGDFVVDNGNISITKGAAQLQVEGGAATDFIGTATLVGGTVTIANTFIVTTDRIFLSYTGALSASGQLTSSIIASTSFTITSSSGTDTSTVSYFIVRQLQL